MDRDKPYPYNVGTSPVPTPISSSIIYHIFYNVNYFLFLLLAISCFIMDVRQDASPISLTPNTYSDVLSGVTEPCGVRSYLLTHFTVGRKLPTTLIK